MWCRSLADVLNAADTDSHDDKPMSQETADLVAAILAATRTTATAA